MEAIMMRGKGRRLQRVDVPIPRPGSGEVLIRIAACAICRTDLHIFDGELRHPKMRLIPGHQIVGSVVESGPGSHRFTLGSRVGVPWLGWTCGTCQFCTRGQENLCDGARFTGYTVDGGYASFTVADERFCFAIPESYADEEAAPLLCAGLTGYRALQMTGDAARLGFYGFGASARILTQLARLDGREVYAFTRPGDVAGQASAREFGAIWAGDAEFPAPEELDGSIIFASDGKLVPAALAAVAKGGTVVCAGIHMSDIPQFPYSSLWGERTLRSVSNLTREDGEQFFERAAAQHLRVDVESFPLSAVNAALVNVRRGTTKGVAVLRPSQNGH